MAEYKEIDKDVKYTAPSYSVVITMSDGSILQLPETKGLTPKENCVLIGVLGDNPHTILIPMAQILTVSIYEIGE